MILFVESKLFPHRSFVIKVQPHETVARIRAQLLHILYELGHEDHQFRLRFKGDYLRDAYCIDDYAVVENAIIKMVSLSKKELHGDDKSLSSMKSIEGGPGITLDVKHALLKEVKFFNYREKLIGHLKALEYIHVLAVFLAFLTVYWYCGLWSGALWLVCYIYCPTFTRQAGWIGTHSIYRVQFCVIYGIVTLCAAATGFFLSTREWIKITKHGCTDWEFVDDCAHRNVFSAIFYVGHAVCFLISCIICWILLWNMRVDVGDYIEYHLVKTRDIEYILKSAKHGRTKERRFASYELATLASTNDDNKFLIVADGGLDVLSRMALSNDEITQDNAVEALSEILTIPTIQDSFVNMGGVKTLTALLHTSSPRLVYFSSVALLCIATDSEESKGIIIADHGLEDLCYAANNSAISSQRNIAGIFLELAFVPEIRAQLVVRNTPAVALKNLIKTNDSETQRLALQTLELLSIESSDMICAQEELLHVLLDLPLHTVNENIYLPAGKILLYFAENIQTCEEIMGHESLKECLSLYVRNKDPVLQKIIIKLIFCIIDIKELRVKATQHGLDQLLHNIKDHAADREAWNMADQALQMLASDGDLASLPNLSTVEKLSLMDQNQQEALFEKPASFRQSAVSINK